MSVATASDYLEAIAHLPPGTALITDGVSWEEYEQLLADLGPSYSVRIFYDEGRMEIMCPVPAHEKPVKVVHTLVIVLRDELDIDIESLGATTYREELKDRGAEPDDSFYVQHAAAVIGKLDLNLQRDPPPDLVVESDHTSSSLDKFAIYAALGVPEIWRITRNQVHLWLLEEGRYNESDVSRAFPFLPAEKLNECLSLGLAEGERKAAKALREWVKANRPIIP